MKKQSNIISAPVYLGLVHFPVYNIHQEVVCTSVTPFDLHDIARTAKTYGVKKYFIISPLESQRRLIQRIMDHWLVGIGGQSNETRKQAFEGVQLVSSLEEVYLTIEKQTAKQPRTIATSAKAGSSRISFSQLQSQFQSSDKPQLLLFGTGWGMTNELLAKMDLILEPIMGGGDGSYNHLPVRAAVAIILDRLLAIA